MTAGLPTVGWSSKLSRFRVFFAPGNGVLLLVSAYFIALAESCQI
jgi:hypothetical protein